VFWRCLAESYAQSGLELKSAVEPTPTTAALVGSDPQIGMIYYLSIALSQRDKPQPGLVTLPTKEHDKRQLLKF
jgi:hypothetical protein